MAFFKVMLHGVGIDIPGPSEDRSIIGFYAARIVRARSPSQAEERAIGMVLHTWNRSRQAAGTLGTPPRITIESLEVSSLLERLRFKNSGFTFYSRE